MNGESHGTQMTVRTRVAAAIALALTLSLTCGSSTQALAASDIQLSVRSESLSTERSWSWPVDGLIQITSPYRQPDSEYTAGHRGIDLLAAGTGYALAPAAGTVAFVGIVVDRPLVTIAHSNGLVSTLEPVLASLSVGESVTAGQVIGAVTTGGHTALGSVHWGVRRDGDYINPATLLGAVRRPILLPCCEG